MNRKINYETFLLKCNMNDLECEERECYFLIKDPLSTNFILLYKDDVDKMTKKDTSNYIEEIKYIFYKKRRGEYVKNK